MNVEELRKYCLAKQHVTESFPFDDTSLVFKVFDKIFLISNLSSPFYFNAKCDPALALELREKYHFIQPGYHMNKNHWNSVYIEDCFDDELIISLIDQSFNLVVSKLNRNQKEQLNNINVVR